jgi:hypothetical protein
MAKIISVWKRDALVSLELSYIQKICNALAPDDLIPSNPFVQEYENWSIGILNPPSGLKASAMGVMLGHTLGDIDWKTCSPSDLDGSFAIFRNSENQAEILNDYSGSRSIWYYLDAEYFVASTSQRAIIMFLGSFHLNEQVIPWMLSTGTLGPDNSWDARIKLLPPDSSLTLDKSSWETKLKVNPIVFKETEIPTQMHRDKVLNAINETFDKLNPNFSTWAITLSGGKDSRGILMSLAKKFTGYVNLRTYTYGLDGDPEVKGSDAYVARLLADKYGVKNEFYVTNTISNELPISVIYDRILKAGEGRVDHFASYMDGMAFWKYVFEQKVETIIRGDVAFGNANKINFKSEEEAKYFRQAFLCRDWANLSHLESYYPGQAYPDYMEKLDHESYNSFYEKNYVQFRMPLVMAALSDFKLSYVELINPLLSKKILSAVRELPDNLRNGAIIWKEYLAAFNIDIPFAKLSAYDDALNEMGKKSNLQYQIETINASPYLPDVLKRLAQTSEKKQKGLKNLLTKLFRASRIKFLLSRKQRYLIWQFLHVGKKPKLAKEKLVNRVFILAKMQEVLNQDAALKSIYALKEQAFVLKMPNQDIAQ